MKKVFALGVASLVMLGTASQASAYFEAGNFVMSVYDKEANLEMGIDLGAISLADLQTANLNKVLVSGLDFTGFTFNTLTSGVGVWAMDTSIDPVSTYKYGGWFGTTNSTGTAVINLTYANGSSLFDADDMVRPAYGNIDTKDGNTNGIALSTTGFAGSYAIWLNRTQAGGYAGVQGQVGVEAEYPVAATYVDLYIYQWFTNEVWQNEQVNYGGPVNGVAVIRLTNDGQVILNPGTAEVPVPGAAWLLGAGLLGLAGIRRKTNS